jgi:hypothetical protein
MDIFAPGSKNPNCFIVKNIDPQHRTLFIFQYPINYGCTRNLILIPGVAEDDIRASCLKGELQRKMQYGEIEVICSDIDLLQFNETQLAFLQNAGIVNGLQITSGQIDVIEQQDIQLIGVVDGFNTIYTIPDNIWIQSAPYKIIVYKNGVKQVLGDDYFISESGGPGTGYNIITMSIPPSPTPLPVDILTADYYITNA